MPYLYKHRRAPEPWKMYRTSVRWKVLIPLLYVEWLAEWIAYVLSQLSVLEVLEYAGSLSILVGVISYFADAGDRLQQKHYQAWQVINTAQGKGGNGGRIDALEQLNADHVALVGIDVSDAFLVNVKLPNAKLNRSKMSSADMRGANLSHADLELSDLISTNFESADLSNAHLSQADINNGDLTGANLKNADLMKANLSNVDLTGADLANSSLEKADLRTADLSGLVNWKSITSIRLANIAGIKNAPDGFVNWAKSQGAVEASNEEWEKLLKK